MIDRSSVDAVLAANRYLVLGTADADGRPRAAPPHPERRDAIAITVFDSTVAVGRAEAAYFDAQAARVPPGEVDGALQALNSRLPQDKRLSTDDLQPAGPLVGYRADLEHSYLLVRGGNFEFGNAVDTTVEV